MWGVLSVIFAGVFSAIAVVHFFPGLRISIELARIGDALAVFFGPGMATIGGLYAKHVADHSRWEKTGGKEGAKMNASTFWRDVGVALTIGPLLGLLMDWQLQAPLTIVLLVATLAGFLSPIISAVVVESVRKVADAIVARLRGGPPTDGGV